MIQFPKWGLLLAFGAMAFVAVPRASATAELFLSDGNGHTATVVAGSCGVGCASFNGALGDWNINITTGTASPGESPVMDLNTIDHHNLSGTATTLTIAWSSDTFPTIPPSATQPQGFQLNVGGTVGPHGTVTAALYGGLSDTLFDTSNQIGTTLTFTNPPVSFSGTEDSYLSSLSPNPFSLTEVATITFGKFAGQASFDYSVDQIPEPAGVLLLGTAILFTVSFVRRRIGAGQSKRV